MFETVRAKLAFTFFILPLVFCIVVGIDSWPYSNFPLFSKPARLGRFENYNLFLVSADGVRTRLKGSSLLYPLNPEKLNARIRFYLIQGESEEMFQLMLDYYSRKITNFKKIGRWAGPLPVKIQVGILKGKSGYSDGKLWDQIEDYKVLAEKSFNEKI